jgi:hypothetical protein
MRQLQGRNHSDLFHEVGAAGFERWLRVVVKRCKQFGKKNKGIVPGKSDDLPWTDQGALKILSDCGGDKRLAEDLAWIVNHLMDGPKPLSKQILIDHLPYVKPKVGDTKHNTSTLLALYQRMGYITRIAGHSSKGFGQVFKLLWHMPEGQPIDYWEAKGIIIDPCNVNGCARIRWKKYK